MFLKLSMDILLKYILFRLCCDIARHGTGARRGTAAPNIRAPQPKPPARTIALQKYAKLS